MMFSLLFSKWGAKVNNLEIAHLKRICDKYGIDYYEMDSSLTYWENKKHLMGIVNRLRLSLDCFELARMESLQEQYLKEHFLSYFVMCQLNNEATPAEVGKLPDSPKFSLVEFVKRQG